MRAHEVEDFDDDLRRLVERMTSLMEDANGVGLAANQAGVLRRALRLPRRGEEEPPSAVNPRVLDAARSGRSTTRAASRSRACSFPWSGATVRLTLEAQDVEGRRCELELTGLDARVASTSSTTSTAS